MENSLYVEAKKLYIAHMLFTKASTLLKEAKKEERADISKKLSDTRNITKIDTSHLFDKDKSIGADILEIKDKQVFLNNTYVKKAEKDMYIPFEVRTTRKVANPSQFEDFFGKESLAELTDYSLLPKTDIYKIVGAKSKTPIDEVYDLLPNSLKSIAKIKHSASIGYKRNAIKWNDAYQFIETDEVLKEIYKKIDEYITAKKTPTLFEINNLIKPIETFVLTGETASFNMDSKYFDSKLFVPSLKQSFTVDSKKLKQLINEEDESIYQFTKINYKNISGNLSKTVSFFDNETLIKEAGVRTQESIVLYDFIKTEQDIQNFIHSHPEYTSEKITYGEYLEKALSIEQSSNKLKI